jgi:hypothetical protein
MDGLVYARWNMPRLDLHRAKWSASPFARAGIYTAKESAAWNMGLGMIRGQDTRLPFLQTGWSVTA